MDMKRMNFEYLLGGLLIIILSFAIAQEAGVRVEVRRLFMEPALCIMLLMGIWSLGREKKWLIIGGIIAVAGVATATINFFWDMPELRIFQPGDIVCVWSGQHRDCFPRFAPFTLNRRE